MASTKTRINFTDTIPFSLFLFIDTKADKKANTQGVGVAFRAKLTTETL
jgi:hypothetical protein